MSHLVSFSNWTGQKFFIDRQILDPVKFRTTADDKFSVGKIQLKFSDRAENIVGKGENAGYHHFPLFSTIFSEVLFSRVMKTRDCLVKGYIFAGSNLTCPLLALLQSFLSFDYHIEGGFQQHCGKRENAGIQIF